METSNELLYDDHSSHHFEDSNANKQETSPLRNLWIIFKASKLSWTFFITSILCILFVNIALLIFVFPFLPPYTYRCEKRFLENEFRISSKQLDFVIQNETSRLNEFKQRGTHNSYHKLHWSRFLFSQLNYELPPISQQLEDGMRHLEFDVHYINGEWLVYHLRFLDSATQCHCLQECLSILQSWRRMNPDHFPITLWIEPKYRLELKNMCYLNKEMIALENIFKEVFGYDSIYRPFQAQGKYETLRDAVINEGWPTIQKLKGKVILVMAIWEENIRCGELALEYSMQTKESTKFRENALFFIRASSTSAHYASILEMEVNDYESINKAVDQGFIIRGYSNKTSNPLRLDSKVQLIVGDNSFVTRPLHKSLWNTTVY